MHCVGLGLLVGVTAVSTVAAGGQATSSGARAKTTKTDSSVIAPDGTAYVTRVVPVPTTVSREAQRMLGVPLSDKAVPQTLVERRRGTDTWQAGTGEAFRKLYPVDVRAATVAGVPVRMITPPSIPEAHRARVLINLHGGGFTVDSGSLSESIPVAALAQMQTIAVLYRLSPEHKFPAAVEDAVAVYREVLKTHRPQDVGIFGTSAGAILTAEVAVELKRLGLPRPGALGIFSGMGDFSRTGDSEAMYSLNGLSGHLAPPVTPEAGMGVYTGATSLQDSVLSPVFADLHGMPPTLFLTSSRDLLLSGTTTLHRAFLRAQVDAQLVVFEALPHAFWNNPSLPETREADEMMANFFAAQLGRGFDGEWRR